MMLGLTRTASRKLLAPVGLTQKCSIRHKTVRIFTISPPVQPTIRTMGPYPRTPEEFEKAARKYNLIPEDYKPFPEDEGFGDYPDLPAIGAYNRDKYDDYEDIWEMRHWGEPLHLHADVYAWERKDPMWDEKIHYVNWPYWKKCATFFGFMFVLYGTAFAMFELRINFNWPWKIRTYNEGRDMYAFPVTESAHNSHH